MRTINPKVSLGIFVVVVLILLVSLAEEMNRRLQVQSEIQQLEQEVQSMERRVIELSHLNTYFGTEAYQERLAREKLNFRAPGEKVVLIPDGPSETDQPTASAPDQETSSIALRWWHVFFVEE